MISSEIQKQISEFGMRYSIQRGFYLWYKPIHPWLTEQMLRYSFTKQANDDKQDNNSTVSNTNKSCIDGPSLGIDHKDRLVICDSVGVEVKVIIHFGHSTQNIS